VIVAIGIAVLMAGCVRSLYPLFVDKDLVFFLNPGPLEPLKGVPDDSGPIMAIASLTMADKPYFAGISLPISQISIELYQPITGGIFLGSRFAPAGLKVPDMRDLTPSGK